MGDAMALAVIVVMSAVITGLLYLLYLPFRKKIKRSGKLGRRIDITFIVFSSLLALAAFLFRDYRVPSKDRLERVAGIELPREFEVLRDEYQDMWQDYCILYHIQFDDRGLEKLILSIKGSRFYNKEDSLNRTASFGHDLTQDGRLDAVWARSSNGFNFIGQDVLTFYFINVDTVTNILEFQECAD